MAEWWEVGEPVETGPKAAPAWGPGAVELPDGSVVRYGPRGGTTILRKSTGMGADAVPVALTEDQGKAQTYARLMRNAEQSYESAVGQGYNPGGFRNSTASMLEGLPFGGLDGLGAVIRDEVGDRGRQAELQWSDAQLKAVSGAASPEAEVKRNVRSYFARPGEDFGDIAPQKRAARTTAFEAAKMRAGPAGPQVGGYPTAPPPAPAVATYNARVKARQIDRAKPVGTALHPYIARDEATLNRLPKGSYVIGPNGDFGVIE